MIASHRGEIPFLVLLLPFLAGTALGMYNTPATALLWGILISSVLIFCALNAWYGKLKIYKNQWAGGLLIISILLFSGWIRAVQSNELSVPDHFSRVNASYLVVRVNSEPQPKEGFTRFTCSVVEAINKEKRLPVSGTLLITLKDTSQKPGYGDELVIPARYQLVEPPYNPAEFNYKSYLAGKNIFYQAFLYPGQIKLLQTGAGNPLMAFSFKLRQKLVNKLKQNIPDPDAAAVASTLILGYKADLSGDVRRTYADTGTIHVLSVSGAHVAAIYGLLLIALGFTDRLKYGRPIKAVIVILLLWFYAMLTGFSPSVCRAVTMITIVTGGKTFRRNANTLNTLAASAFAMLLYNPRYITDAGFQLSYLAIFGIVVFQPVIYRWFSFRSRWLSKLWALCSVSAAAQLAVLPLSLYYFHQFPVYFLAANLFIVVPAMIIIYTGIIFLLLPQIAFLTKTLAFILWRTIQLTNRCLRFIEHIPYADIRKIWFTLPEQIIFYALIITLFYLIFTKQKRWLWAALSCLFFLSLSVAARKIAVSASNSVTWLNIGKHTGIVFRNGRQAIVLTDLGRADKIYQYSIQPYLDSCGASNTAVYSPQQNISTTWLKKKSGLIQFFNQRIFIFGQRQNNNPLNPKINTPYVYISGNPAGDAAFIATNFNCGKIIIDGTNSDKRIEEWLQQLKKYNINYYLLKRNKSLIAISN